MKLDNIDKHLIDKARKNDRVAQKALFEKFNKKMLSICRSFACDIQEAEDILLVSFSKVFKNLSSYNNKGSLEGWIRRIVINEAINSQKKKSLIDLKENLTIYEKINENKPDVDIEYWQLLMDRLPINLKQAFILSVLEGYSHSEVGELLNITPNASKQRVKRAKAELRNMNSLLKNTSHGL